MKLSPLSMTRSFQTPAGFEGLPPWHPPGAGGLHPSLSLRPLGTCLTAWSLRPLRGTNGNYKAFCSKKKPPKHPKNVLVVLVASSTQRVFNRASPLMSLSSPCDNRHFL